MMGSATHDGGLLPVVVSVYTRVEHFRKCVEALQRNTLAAETRLVICSDAASRLQDEAAVREVRAIARSITGFRRVDVIERVENMGAIVNAGSCFKQVLREHGAGIFMEDDVLTAPGFLAFLNEAFRCYSSDPRVVSITGYCPPIKLPADMINDAFLLPRFKAWGMAISEANYYRLAVNPDREELEAALCNGSLMRRLAMGGVDLVDMLRLQVAGKINAYDVKANYYMATADLLTVYPRKSLVFNCGHDGSGLHCGASNRFDVAMWEKTEDFRLDPNIALDRAVLKANWKFHTRPPLKRLERWIKRWRWVQAMRGHRSQ